MHPEAKGYHLRTTSQLILESVTSFSQFIDKLIKIGEEFGLTFDLFASELDVAGRIHYDKKLIEINVPGAKDAVITVAHELGHWVGYQKHGHKSQNSYTVEEREGFAQKYGWELLQQIGADKAITKAEWDEA